MNSTAAAYGNISVVGCTLDLVTFTANRGATVAGGSITVSNGATLKIGGTISFPTNYATHTLGATSTVEYGGTTQTVTLESYGNLTLSSSSSGGVVKTMPASALTIATNFTTSVGSAPLAS